MSNPTRRFHLDKSRGMIGGVCAGIASYFDVDPIFVRIACVVGFITWPLTIVVYVVLFIALSNKPTDIKEIGEQLGNTKIGKHFKDVNYRKRIYKSSRHKRISGVCGGIAEYFETSPFFVRILFLLSLFFGPFAIFVYIAAAILMEKNPDELTYSNSRSHRRDRQRSSKNADSQKQYAQSNRSPNDATKPFDKRDLRECTARFSELEKKLQRLEATITSKKFKLHNEIKRMAT